MVLHQVAVLLFLMVPLSSAAPGNRSCPPLSGMAQYGSAGSTTGGKWYLAGPNRKTFDGAATYCADLGLALATVAGADDLSGALTILGDLNFEGWVDLTFDPALAPCYSAQDCDGAFFSPSSSVVAAVDPDDLLMYYVAPGVLANAGGFHCLRFEGSGGKVQLRSESCGAKLLPVCEADCGAEFRLCRPDALVSHELSPPSGSFYHGSLAKYTFDLAPLYCTVLPPYGGEQQSWWRLASVSNVEGYSGLTYFTRDGGPHDYHSGSWVDLHNPDLNVCDDNPSCDGAFRDLDGDLVSTLGWDPIVWNLKDVFKQADHHCLRWRTSDKSHAVRDEDCSKQLYVVCELDCVDGSWSSWVATAGSCSVTCGGGLAEETRQCDSPDPGASGKPCPGASRRVVPCDTGVDCELCPPYPQNGDIQQGKHFLRKSDTTLSWDGARDWCADQGMRLVDPTDTAEQTSLLYSAIAVSITDGTYGAWVDLKTGNAATCAGNGPTCDGDGYGGVELRRGDGSVADLAYLPNVLVNDGVADRCIFYSLVDGGIVDDDDCSNSGAYYAACVAVCDVITCPARYPYAFDGGASCCDLSRECSGPVLARSDACCAGSWVDCVDQQRGCYDAVVHGSWSAWSNATACNATCGSIGLVLQERACDSPPEANGGEPCSGDDTQAVPCHLGSCQAEGEWSVWHNGTCSVPCGNGTMRQTRNCSNPEMSDEEVTCAGEPFRDVDCNVGPCPAEGEWSIWNNGTCSVPCGNGTMRQTRNCSNPEVAGKEVTCTGEPFRDVDCNVGPCPVNGSLCAWADAVGDCPVSCGGLGLSLMPQTRECGCPAPAHGGGDCEGERTRDIDCGVASCPPSWSGWDEWGPCTKTCDYGVRQRTRHCDPPGQCAGLGLDTQTSYCPTVVNGTSCSGGSIIVTATQMAAYHVTAAARDAFLSSAAAVVATDGAVAPDIFCSLQCLRLRAQRSDFRACNGYYLHEGGGSCHLGYADPDWVYGQALAPGGAAVLHFDIVFP